jgi:sulfotransferase family protein
LAERKLPTFIVVGAQRAGTTYLAQLLSSHPDVYMAPGETHYFTRAGADRTQAELREYSAFFEGAGDQAAVGEKTPSYLYFPWVPEMIARHLPGVKLIVLLRDPIKRAYSHYWRTVRVGREPLSFRRALAAEPERLTQSHMHRVQYSYQDRGRYVPQLRRYLNVFPRAQLHLEVTEDMHADPRATLSRVTAFLGLPEPGDVELPTDDINHASVPRWLGGYRTLTRLDLRWQNRQVLRAFASAARGLRDRIPGADRPYPPMAEATKRQLAEVFRDDATRVGAALRRDLHEWSVFDPE